jgi:hypothetical protein
MTRINSIDDLSSGDIRQLSQLLSLPPRTLPDRRWLRDQAHRIPQLTATLQRPSSVLARLVMCLPFTPNQACLCSAHRSLNPYLIRRIFLRVSAECTTHLARLVENPFLPARISDLVKRLHRVNSLWLAPQLYRVAFGALASDPRFDCLPSRCEACILAIVGGDQSILSDLRASLRGRKKRHHPVAELLPLVDAWVDYTRVGDAIRAESKVLGRQIQHCRQQMQRERRQKKRNDPVGIVDAKASPESVTAVGRDVSKISGEEKNSIDEHDAEGSIINFYANLLSTASLVPHSFPTTDVHPAFRNSVILSPLARAFHRTSTEPRRSNCHSAHSESIYSSSSSVEALSLDFSSTLKLKGRASDEYAEEYRKLVVFEEEEEKKEKDGYGVTECERRDTERHGNIHKKSRGV